MIRFIGNNITDAENKFVHKMIKKNHHAAEFLIFIMVIKKYRGIHVNKINKNIIPGNSKLLSQRSHLLFIFIRIKQYIII